MSTTATARLKALRLTKLYDLQFAFQLARMSNEERVLSQAFRGTGISQGIFVDCCRNGIGRSVSPR
jgi:hypothetical protein